MIAAILICRLDVSTAAGALHQNGQWRYDGPPVGGWLKIVFDRTYILWSLRIQPYFWINLRYFKDIKLTFSDGSEQTVTMTNMNEGFVFETFPIYPPRLSSNMTLTVVSAYFNGDRVITHINEVEVYGTIPETMTIETTDATTAISAATTAIPPETTLTSAATTVTLSATTGIPPEATTTPLSTTDTIQDKITVKASVVNITAKAKCSSSFDCQPTKKYCSSCYWAIDGDKSTSWHYRGEAVGEWLQIVFDRTYIVTLLHIVPSYWAAQRHFKQVKLTFSDGSEQTHALRVPPCCLEFERTKSMEAKQSTNICDE
ncbi:hypothetical protein LSAT2_032974 [Lamellibrachia satsuma]|nr:hypothetical protein LSAT2_032974 [Lamellibrachia satsuma]